MRHQHTGQFSGAGSTEYADLRRAVDPVGRRNGTSGSWAGRRYPWGMDTRLARLDSLMISANCKQMGRYGRDALPLIAMWHQTVKR
ncbi:MAG: hypothetical protein ACOX30_09155 [Dethiobacteria bacterium]